MKRGTAILKLLCVVLGWLFGPMLQLQAQGYLVPNGVTLHPFNSIYVIQNPTNSDYTGFFLEYQGARRFLFSPFLDEGVRTFLVSSNDPIRLEPILANSYAELTYPNTYFFAEGSQFYLAFYTGYLAQDSQGHYTGNYLNPLFGWARLVNNQGAIEMLDSALVFQAEGIYAGTQNIIPEPDVLALIVAGVFALTLFRRAERCSGERGRRTFNAQRSTFNHPKLSAG